MFPSSSELLSHTSSLTLLPCPPQQKLPELCHQARPLRAAAVECAGAVGVGMPVTPCWVCVWSMFRVGCHHLRMYCMCVRVTATSVTLVSQVSVWTCVAQGSESTASTHLPSVMAKYSRTFTRHRYYVQSAAACVSPVSMETSEFLREWQKDRVDSSDLDFQGGQQHWERRRWRRQNIRDRRKWHRDQNHWGVKELTKPEAI